jgi:hypothetical protein
MKASFLVSSLFPALNSEIKADFGPLMRDWEALEGIKWPTHGYDKK